MTGQHDWGLEKTAQEWLEMMEFGCKVLSEYGKTERERDMADEAVQEVWRLECERTNG